MRKYLVNDMRVNAWATSGNDTASMTISNPGVCNQHGVYRSVTAGFRRKMWDSGWTLPPKHHGDIWLMGQKKSCTLSKSPLSNL